MLLHLDKVIMCYLDWLKPTIYICQISDSLTMPVRTSYNDIMEEIGYRRFSRDLVVIQPTSKVENIDSNICLERPHEYKLPIINPPSTTEDQNVLSNSKSERNSMTSSKVCYI